MKHVSPDHVVLQGHGAESVEPRQQRHVHGPTAGGVRVLPGRGKLHVSSGGPRSAAVQVTFLRGCHAPWNYRQSHERHTLEGTLQHTYLLGIQLLNHQTPHV